MQKMSFRKLSILGLVLMAASAVTAAIIPSNSKDAKFAEGSLTASTATQAFPGSGATCTAKDNLNGPACNVTSPSGTTEVSNGSSDQNGDASTADA